jgi:hypothetical protein
MNCFTFTQPSSSGDVLEELVSRCYISGGLGPGVRFR